MIGRNKSQLIIKSGQVERLDSDEGLPSIKRSEKNKQTISVKSFGKSFKLPKQPRFKDIKMWNEELSRLDQQENDLKKSLRSLNSRYKQIYLKIKIQDVEELHEKKQKALEQSLCTIDSLLNKRKKIVFQGKAQIPTKLF